MHSWEHCQSSAHTRWGKNHHCSLLSSVYTYLVLSIAHDVLPIIISPWCIAYNSPWCIVYQPLMYCLSAPDVLTIRCADHQMCWLSNVLTIRCADYQTLMCWLSDVLTISPWCAVYQTLMCGRATSKNIQFSFAFYYLRYIALLWKVQNGRWFS